jgi:hypothetical protein
MPLAVAITGKFKIIKLLFVNAVLEAGILCGIPEGNTPPLIFTGIWQLVGLLPVTHPAQNSRPAQSLSTVKLRFMLLEFEEE